MPLGRGPASSADPVRLCLFDARGVPVKALCVGIGTTTVGAMTDEAPTVVGAEPVTTLIYRRAKPGHEAEYERLLHQMIAAASTFAGHLDASVVRPHDDERGYLLLFRFATRTELAVWLKSSERASILGEIAPHADREFEVHKKTGLEVWFEHPLGDAQTSRDPLPPRAKMAAVILLGQYPIVLLLSWLLSPQLSTWPLALRSLITSAITVLLLTWVVMPFLTRILGRWLAPGTR